MNAKTKSSWICPGCLIKEPKLDNTNTPVRAARLPSPSGDCAFLGQEMQHAPAETDNNTLLTDLKSSSLREIIRQEISQALRESVKSLFSEQFNKINNLIADFQQSLTFYSGQYDDIKSKLEEKCIIINKLEKDNAFLMNSLKDLRRDLNSMEQHARSNNVELHCVPEHRSENLINTVLQLSKVIKCDIKDTDIMYCSRIAKMNPKSNRPRSVLVKFGSPRIRDTFLAASQQYNKNNKKNKLNSADLGIASDTPSPIYIIEHLSPTNKIIHAATRLRAKEINYKFVWVRGGRIFMKKDEVSETIVIGSLEKLKSVS
ncbi:unnamed protein product [Colias eurytheme]|nr:unnamed protein product [Colias eurytheme]